MNENEPMEPPSNNIKKRNNLLVRIILVSIVAGLLFFAYWWMYLTGYEYTQNAYVGGDMVGISPKIMGTVVSYYCEDNDFVEEGQLLVELDPTDYRIAFEAQKAAFASSVRQVVNLKQHAGQLQAGLSAKKILLERAKEDYFNRTRLIDSRAISKEELEHAKAEFDFATYQYMITFHELEGTLALLGNTSLREHPQIMGAKENLRNAYLNLKRCRIRSPITGLVAKRSVQVGETANPAKIMMQVIPLRNVWIDANFKEDQLKNIRINQTATIQTDLYANKVIFQGKVQGIQAGTGSVFALLPAQNATGNWIKIVQRVPVRITLDPSPLKDFPLLIGLSASVTIDISDQSGPVLMNVPSQQQVTKTPIFEIPMEEVDQLIEDIIRQNSLSVHASDHPL